MNWRELKNELKDVKGYVGPDDIEAQKIEIYMLKKIDDILRMSQEEKEDYEEIKRIKEKYSTTANNLDATQIEDIEKLKEASVNYKFPEFMIYIMWDVHNKFVTDNISKYDLKTSKEAYKFVPFNLLNWNEVDKRYYSVLTPILDAMDIKHDKEATKKQFKRNQLVFLINKGIYSKQDLQEKMKDMRKFFPELLISRDEKGNKVSDILSEESTIQNITNQVAKKIDLNVANLLKQSFLDDKNEIGIIHVEDLNERKGIYKFAGNLGQRKIGFKRIAYPKPNKPISKIMYELSNEAGIIFAQNIKKHDYKYTDTSMNMHKKVNFIPYEECTEDLKKQIDKRNKKVKKFVEKVEKGNNKKYIEPGLITLVTIKKEYDRDGMLIKDSQYNQNEGDNLNTSIIQIPMSLKELAQFGVLPQEIGWEANNKSLLHSKRSRLMLTDNNGKDNSTEFKNRLKIENVKTELNTEKHEKKTDDIEKEK